MGLGRLPVPVDLGRASVYAATGTTGRPPNNRTAPALQHRRLQQGRIVNGHRPDCTSAVLEAAPLLHGGSGIGSGGGQRVLLHLQGTDDDRLSAVVSAEVEEEN